MIEIIIREYLESVLDVPVLLEVPKSVPSSYVLMRILDASETNHICAATFSFDITDTSLYKASILTESVRDALDGITILDSVSKAFMGGESSDIDSANKTYQYTLTYNFIYYREED